MVRPLAPLLGSALLLALLAAPLAPAGLLVAAPSPTPIALGDTAQPATRQSPMRELAALHAADFPLDPLPAGLDAAGRADYLLNVRQQLGRTPAEWIGVADGFGADLEGREVAAAPEVRLTAALDALYAAAGVVPSEQDVRNSRSAAASMDPSIEPALAGLVAAVAEAYAGQASVAASMPARWAAWDGVGALLAPAERDAMAERASHIVGSIGKMGASVGPGPDVVIPTARVCLAPLAPDCLAWSGSWHADSYPPTPGPFPDPILIVDSGGDDTYTNSAGGANPTGLIVPGPNPAGGNGLAISVVADLGGNDDYTYSGEVSVLQGSGSVGGLGILVDTDGDDRYFADFERTTVGPALVAGVGTYYIDGGAQGTGYAGLGLLLDAWGDDVYDQRISSSQGRCIWGFSQGFGGAGGLGISSDLWGDDAWLSSGTGLTGGNDCWGVGTTNDAFQGMYPQGVGIYAGVGIMTDNGLGRDVYLDYNNATTVDYYAQGFGAFGGLGILVEDGGDDVYVAYEKATSTWINPTLNCAYGTGSLGGVGIMLELGGNDEYLVETVSDKGAETMMEGDGEPIPGYGLFIDADGVDRHEGIATTTGAGTTTIYGRGVFDAGHNLAGTYLDLGSDDDLYLPVIAGIGGSADDDSQWLFGIDA
ncbi:MAG: hypothetical protein ACYC2H_07410 [Thermoplasmatota archaeon]